MKNIKLSFIAILIILFSACSQNGNSNSAENNDTSRGSASNPVNNANPVPAINSDSGRPKNDTSSLGDGSMAGSTHIKGESHYGTSQGNNVTGEPAVNRTDTGYKK